MSMRSLFVGLLTVLSLYPDSILESQSRDNLAVDVFFLEDPQKQDIPRLWMKITNNASVARVFCRLSSAYMWFPSDSDAPMYGDMNANVHSCGQDSREQWWLLLAGQSRVDALDVRKPPKGEVQLNVDITVLETVAGSKNPVKRSVSWKGSLNQASANGRQLITAPK